MGLSYAATASVSSAASKFVEPKSAGQQARALLFRTREQLVHQRTELVNALRSYLYEYGHVLPIGILVLMVTRVCEDFEKGLVAMHATDVFRRS